MKTLVTFILSGVVSTPLCAATKSSVDVLNDNLTECYEHTLTQAKVSKRACNAVIRSKIATRENIAIAYHNRGVINLKLGNQAEALQDFSSAANRNSSLSQSVTALRQLKQETQALAKVH